MSHCDEAITRVKKLQWPANPSSNIYAFIEALENEKKAETAQKVCLAKNRVFGSLSFFGVGERLFRYHRKASA